MRYHSQTALLLAVLLTVSSLFCLSGCRETPTYRKSEGETYTLHENLLYGKGVRQTLDLCIPNDRVCDGLILLIHGGGWVAGEKEDYRGEMLYWAERGYCTAAVNYRYISRTVHADDLTDDIAAALSLIYQTLADAGICCEKALLSGASAGGHLSLLYAYSCADKAPIRPIAVVSYCGPTDLNAPSYFTGNYGDTVRNWFAKLADCRITAGNEDAAQAALTAVSPLAYASENAVPTVICHGMVDDLVPYQNAVDLYDALCAAGVTCELYACPHSGHGLDQDPDVTEQVRERFAAFAATYLS